MVKRVLILIGVALGVGLVIGNVSGYALKNSYNSQGQAENRRTDT